MAESFWEPTQAILQGPAPLVKKPKLTEALLRKPPFRFLHDVISEVQRNTGYAVNLYSGIELDAKAIQDKEGKMSYLQKMIDQVSSDLGLAATAKPAKIVAGLDAEDTNTFLQMLAKAASGQSQAARPSASTAAPPQAQRQEALQQPTADLAPPALSEPDAGPALAQHQPATDALPAQSTPSQGETEQPNMSSTSATAALAASASSSAAAPAAMEPQSAVGLQGSAPRSQHRPIRSMAQDAKLPTDTDASGASPSTAADGAAQQAAVQPAAQVGAEPAGQSSMMSQRPSMAGRPERPMSARRGPPKLPGTASAAGASTSALGSTRPGTSSGRPGTSSGRPSTASRPPSLLNPNQQQQQKQQEVQQQEQQQSVLPVRQGGSRPMSGRARLPAVPGARPASAGLRRSASPSGTAPGPLVNVVEEGQGDDDEADILVVNDSLVGRGRPSDATGQGALVRNILEAEKALQGEDSHSAQEQGTGIVLRRKKREGSSPTKAGDALALADMVQKLCQSTNPLARCVEYLQEDLETMNTELRFWSVERQQYQEQLTKQQQSHANEAGYKAQLADIDGQIEAAEQRILIAKKNVLQNDMHIQKLLRMSVGA